MRAWLRLAPALMLLAVLFAGFVALGNWQVQRRAWKLDLIARVEQRVHAPPVAAPGRETWARIGKAQEYSVVAVDGDFLHEHEAQVQALTEKGAGYWVLTPLRTSQGFIVWINRGFVEADHRDPATRRAGQPAGPVHLSGLLRLSEPRGSLLRHNDAASGRWYSRDVAALSIAQGLPVQDVAPYFVDAAASAAPRDGEPLGGLTVLQFRNSHLVYALTWYALALLTALGTATLIRYDRRARPAVDAH